MVTWLEGIIKPRGSGAESKNTERLIRPITDILATGDFMFEVFLDIEWHVLHVGFDTLTNCLGFRARV